MLGWLNCTSRFHIRFSIQVGGFNVTHSIFEGGGNDYSIRNKLTSTLHLNSIPKLNLMGTHLLQFTTPNNPAQCAISFFVGNMSTPVLKCILESRRCKHKQ
mmetsp:Transcript_109209/g.189256  ORF Transcript_109209/g.189256 Transcript_109209/m.189256 type:complete len:101 (+) Transcript_109209:3405-3707(+)